MNPYVVRQSLRFQRSVAYNEGLFNALTDAMDALDIVEDTKRILQDFDQDFITQQVAVDRIRALYKKVEL